VLARRAVMIECLTILPVPSMVRTRAALIDLRDRGMVRARMERECLLTPERGEEEKRPEGDHTEWQRSAHDASG
jgi:hypothetical protein